MKEEEDNKLKTPSMDEPRIKSIREETKRIREEQEKLQSDNLKNMIPGRRGH